MSERQPAPPPPAGKDKVLKYWDADKFEQLLTLDGHHGEVRLSINP